MNERRIILLDIDSLRWDTLYQHLARVSQAGANLEDTYTFKIPKGCKGDILSKHAENGFIELNSGLGELTGGGKNLIDILQCHASFPTSTLSSHATLFTGFYPNEHGIPGLNYLEVDDPHWPTFHFWSRHYPHAFSMIGHDVRGTTSSEVASDWFWGGFDEINKDTPLHLQRGLVSGLDVPNLFDIVDANGFSTNAVHAFYHGAKHPWKPDGQNAWWHLTDGESRQMKEICGTETVGQYEGADSSAFVKGLLATIWPPYDIKAEFDQLLQDFYGDRWDGLANRMNGKVSIDFNKIRLNKSSPRLQCMYFSSIDEASHIGGLDYQSIYLAWLDHRFAEFLRSYRKLDENAYRNTIYVLFSDHGHTAIQNHVDILRKFDNEVFVADHTGEKRNWGMVQGDSNHFFLKASNGHLGVIGVSGSPPHDPEECRVPPQAAVLHFANQLLDRCADGVFGALVLCSDGYRFLDKAGSAPSCIGNRALQTIYNNVTGAEDLLKTANHALSNSSIFGANPNKILDALKQMSQEWEKPEVSDPLCIVERIRGLNPLKGKNSKAAHIILLPKKHWTFASPTRYAGDHGTLGGHDSLVPLLFFGPHIKTRVTIPKADNRDLTPTVLNMLGVKFHASHFQGRALLDEQLKPILADESNEDGWPPEGSFKDSLEPNDSIKTATPVYVEGHSFPYASDFFSQQLSLHDDQDVDWFRVTFPKPLTPITLLDAYLPPKVNPFIREILGSNFPREYTFEKPPIIPEGFNPNHTVNEPPSLTISISGSGEEGAVSTQIFKDDATTVLANLGQKKSSVVLKKLHNIAPNGCIYVKVGPSPRNRTYNLNIRHSNGRYFIPKPFKQFMPNQPLILSAVRQITPSKETSDLDVIDFRILPNNNADRSLNSSSEVFQVNGKQNDGERLCSLIGKPMLQQLKIKVWKVELNLPHLPSWLVRYLDRYTNLFIDWKIITTDKKTIRLGSPPQLNMDGCIASLYGQTFCSMVDEFAARVDNAVLQNYIEKLRQQILLGHMEKLAPPSLSVPPEVVEMLRLLNKIKTNDLAASITAANNLDNMFSESSTTQGAEYQATIKPILERLGELHSRRKGLTKIENVAQSIELLNLKLKSEWFMAFLPELRMK